MSKEHHILKAILSCSILFVKPSGNVLSWVNFLSWDSVVSMTKIIPIAFVPSHDYKSDLFPLLYWAIYGFSRHDLECAALCLFSYALLWKNWNFTREKNVNCDNLSLPFIKKPSFGDETLSFLCNGVILSAKYLDNEDKICQLVLNRAAATTSSSSLLTKIQHFL